jgi:SAM-dependent methyltransferase
MSPSPHVVWHDVECGAYEADLPLWRELAAAEGGEVLDVGAGTGRVALDLAAAGHRVTALDRDAELLAVLAERARAAGLEVETLVADAAGFDAGAGRFALVAVPMQTIQLLPDARTRAGFFASAARALAPGGLVAAAITADLEPFDDDGALPSPDVGHADGQRFVSQPVAVHADEAGLRIERVRRILGAGGEGAPEQDLVELARVSAPGLAAEGAAHGLQAEPVRHVGATEDHVGSEVVLLRAR